MIVTKAPLRVTFAGGGSDVSARVHGGFGRVFSMTIDVPVYMTVNLRRDKSVVASYSSVERAERPDQLKNQLIRHCLEMGGVTKGVEVHSIGVLPLDACGMGGSGAAAVALLMALRQLQRQESTTLELAECAAAVEIQCMGRTVGKQDHYAAAIGGANEFLFEKENVDVGWSGSNNGITGDFLSGKMVLVPCISGARDASTMLAQQFKEKSPHVKLMADLVSKAIHCFEDCDVAGLIETVNSNWECKRSLASNLSTPSADSIIASVRKLGGGAKLNGAGGGGYVFALLPDRRKTVELLRTYDGSFEIHADPKACSVVHDNGERL